MTNVIGYWSPLMNQELTLQIFTLAGVRVTAGEDVSMTEVSASLSPGYYEATLPSPLGSGCYKSRVYRGTMLLDSGFVLIGSNPTSVATIDDLSSRLDLAVSEINSGITLSQLTEESTPGQYRFTAAALANAPQSTTGAGSPETGVVVKEFTPLAKQQLAGLGISFKQPVWSTEGFLKPFVRGDSYTDALALCLEFTDWPGPDLTTAESILLTAVRLPARATQFQWPATAEATSIGFAIRWELTSLQTDHPAGLYAFDVEASWNDGTVHTLVGPDARLRIVDDQTKPSDA